MKNLFMKTMSHPIKHKPSIQRFATALSAIVSILSPGRYFKAMSDASINTKRLSTDIQMESNVPSLLIILFLILV